MICVARRSVAGDLGEDRRATGEGVVTVFENEHPGPLAEDEPVAVGPGRGDTPDPGQDPDAGLRPRVVAPGTFGLRILKVSEVTRAVRSAIRQDPRLLDVWVEGEIGRATVSSAGIMCMFDALRTISAGSSGGWSSHE